MKFERKSTREARPSADHTNIRRGALDKVNESKLTKRCNQHFEVDSSAGDLQLLLLLALLLLPRLASLFKVTKSPEGDEDDEATGWVSWLLLQLRSGAKRVLKCSTKG